MLTGKIILLPYINCLLLYYWPFYGHNSSFSPLYCLVVLPVLKWWRLLYNTVTLFLHLSLQVLWVKTPTSQRSSGLHQSCVQAAIQWRKTETTGGKMSRFSPSSCPTSHPAVSSQVHSFFSEELISHKFKDFTKLQKFISSFYLC